MAASSPPSAVPAPRRLIPSLGGLHRLPWLTGLAGLWLLLVLVVAVAAPLLAPYPPDQQSLLARFKPPFFLDGAEPRFLLGTDELGRDLLTRLAYGIRTSILVAFAGTAIGAAVGIVLGFLTAHFRGAFEEAVMMLVDVQAALPFFIFALAALAFFGGGFWIFVIIVGLHGWEVYARLTRGLVLSAQSHGYIQAVRSLGAGPLRVHLRHVLPNIASALLVQLTLSFPDIILLETSLSFLGLGIQPPRASLGLMLGTGRDYLLIAWWVAILPGLAITLTTLAMSLLGDWLRDRLDPTLRRSEG
ncbi:ABC transporter permease [Geminicoccaceae bacterium 1502E]|nr:ABC transporter permease [Geminicoccaceae bacterium 1502E]